MKKRKTKSRPQEPSRASVRDVPSVDFAKYEAGRRNPFAKRVKAEGVELDHDEPSAASLREMPELDWKGKGRANPYLERIRERFKASGYGLQVGKGRPAVDAEVGPTTVKSVRLPPAIWKRLEKRAKAEKIALHALIRAALVDLLEGPPKRGKTG